jgi:putative proteasome-type protease
MIMLGEEGERFFVMTSGLRSVRDKVLAYLRRDAEAYDNRSFPSMLEAIGAYARCLRKVAAEDREALEGSDLNFNLHAIIGGQLAQDRAPSMFLVYPEGNWIEVDERTPYLSIGATAYGKPILDRALRYDTEMRHALKLAYLSFDSTRFSSTDVGYPIDLLTYATANHTWREAQFDYEDLVDQRQWWNRHITELAERMPDGPWVDTLLAGSPAPVRLLRPDRES